MKKAIKLTSDNYDCIVTLEHYKEIALSMSSGDYGCHSATEVKVSEKVYKSAVRLFEEEKQLNQYYSEYCQCCGQKL